MRLLDVMDPTLSRQLANRWQIPDTREKHNIFNTNLIQLKKSPVYLENQLKLSSGCVRYRTEVCWGPTLSWKSLLKASRVYRVAPSAFRISEHCFSREAVSLSRTLSSSMDDILRELVGVGGKGLYTSPLTALFLCGSSIIAPFRGARLPVPAVSVMQYHI
jgi:hypothetical protein